jgi:hypothetical protein
MFPREHGTIHEEKPILIGRSWAPKLDISVLRGNIAHSAARQPRPRDVVLLVEVSDTTYPRNRGRKRRRYAAAGIPGHPIVRLQGSVTLVEVGTGPTGRGRAARYADVVRYSARAGVSVPFELDGSGRGQVAVVDLVTRQASVLPCVLSPFGWLCPHLDCPAGK